MTDERGPASAPRRAGVLLAAVAVLFLGLVIGTSVLGSQQRVILRVRSCGIPENPARYASDPGYKAAWDHACNVLREFGVEIQPMLGEDGPLNDTPICATIWDSAAATCVPSTRRP